eukprot:2210325-Pyramimonas_sp.AAC.1
MSSCCCALRRCSLQRPGTSGLFSNLLSPRSGWISAGRPCGARGLAAAASSGAPNPTYAQPW